MVAFFIGKNMNERLIEVIRLIRALFANRLPFRNIHSVDKVDLFLYLFTRTSIINKREGLGIDFTMTIDNTGGLSLRANDIENETTFAVWDTLVKGFEPDSFDYLTSYDILTVTEHVKRFGMDHYGELLSKMATVHGNDISPELSEFVPYPIKINDSMIKEKLKV